MDFLKKVATDVVAETVKGSNKDNNNQNSNNSNNNNGENKDANAKVAEAVLGTLSNALGGGEKGEQKEDVLDKAIDLFQEHVLKAGSQSNESAIEQAKDAQIASAIRTGYKTVSGKDFPIAKSS